MRQRHDLIGGPEHLRRVVGVAQGPVLFGHLRYGKRNERIFKRRIHRHPDDRGRKHVAGLGDMAVTRLGRQDGTLAHFHHIMVRRSVQTGQGALRLVKLGALVIVAVDARDIFHVQFSVGTDGQRIGFRIPVRDPGRKVFGRRHKAHGPPYAPLGIIRVMELFGLQGFHPVQPAFLVVGRPAEFLQHFRQARVENLARVAFPDRMDPELVRLYEKIPVRYLFRDPEAAFACGRHLHFEDPGLFLVGNG